MRLSGHDRHGWNMWFLLLVSELARLAGSVGAARPGNAGLLTGVRPGPSRLAAGRTAHAAPAGR
jgi:hypothetical protein